MSREHGTQSILARDLLRGDDSCRPRTSPHIDCAMPRKPKPPPDDPEQSKRFIEAARELGTDESPEAFERVFRKVVRPKIPGTREYPEKPRSSD
jgi:hypothetical protein